uniref:DUF2283 domain-containing protein n=1 Tax=Caenorhabditis tropicalis TaxID=1561998 RepID=A0A1I7U502_9PELO
MAHFKKESTVIYHFDDPDPNFLTSGFMSKNDFHELRFESRFRISLSLSDIIEVSGVEEGRIRELFSETDDGDESATAVCDFGRSFGCP